MGRFLILLLAVGLCVGAAYYYELGPFAKDEPVGPRLTDHKPKPDLGPELYAAVNPPLPKPIDDEPPAKGRKREVVIPDCHIVVYDKQDVSAAKDGLLIFIGKEVDSEDALAPQGFATVPIMVGGKEKHLAFQRIKEGDVVEFNQMLAMVDPVKALNDRLYKKAKIIA